MSSILPFPLSRLQRVEYDVYQLQNHQTQDEVQIQTTANTLATLSGINNHTGNIVFTVNTADVLYITPTLAYPSALNTSGLVGLNTDSPAHTLDILNATSSLNVLNLQSHAGLGVFSVNNDGCVTIEGHNTNNYHMDIHNTVAGVRTCCMDLYKDGTLEVCGLWVEPMNQLSQPTSINMICVNSTHGVPTGLKADVAFTCSGGTSGTAYQGTLTLSAAHTSLTGSLTSAGSLVISNGLVGLNVASPVHTLDIVNQTSSLQPLHIRNAANTTTLCSLTDGGTFTVSGSMYATDVYITVASVPSVSVGGALGTLDTDVGTLETEVGTLQAEVASLASALTSAGILASATFGANSVLTLVASIVSGSSSVLTDTVGELTSLTLTNTGSSTCLLVGKTGGTAITGTQLCAMQAFNHTTPSVTSLTLPGTGTVMVVGTTQVTAAQLIALQSFNYAQTFLTNSTLSNISITDTGTYSATNILLNATFTPIASGSRATNGYYSNALKVGSQNCGLQISGGYQWDTTQYKAGYGSLTTNYSTDGTVGNCAQTEMMRWISNGTTNLIGILNTAPAHTLDIINTTTSVNALNLQPAGGGSAVFKVDNSGNATATACVTGSTLALTNTNGSNITLPTTYSSTPGANCLGYYASYKNTSTVSVGNSVCTNICSLTVGAGVWLFNCSAGFTFAGTCTFIQMGISTSSSTFDAGGLTLQMYVNSANGYNVIYPMNARYYCGAGATLYANLIVAGTTATANNTNYTTTLQAVRIA